MRITNWGNYPIIDAEVFDFSNVTELREIIQKNVECIPRGMGRCYGDSALNSSIISTLRFNRFLEFDEEEGTLRCESGVTLEEILEVIVPKGWFLSVTPGTKEITIGGAIGSDVHGKNHHKAGAFSSHLLSMKIMLSDGSVTECSPVSNSELFHATCGGMGLTGIVIEAVIKLKKIETVYVKETSIRASCLEEVMSLIEESEHYSYSVAWIDCLSKGKSLGRSHLMLGEFASVDEVKGKIRNKNPLAIPKKRKLGVPSFFPGFLLNSLTIKLFNMLFYYKHIPKRKIRLVAYDSFFYPLDVIRNWNRLYGKSGFTQYQMVLPIEQSKEGFTKILTLIAQNKIGAFLSILKTFGEQDGVLSFPRRGYTLTLDMPISKKALTFMDMLDDVILNFGGRLYLTKDVRMKKNMFMQSYANSDKFIKFKHEVDANNRFHSLQSKRIGI
ncbi:FAD-binding oxidoreductase [bacterium]|nr:FAD-binding oxidoreductase [bacterium]